MKKESSLGFLKDLAERTSQVVFAYDIDARLVVYLNPSFEQVWNRTRESIYANPSILLETVHPKDKKYVIEVFQKLIQEPGEIEEKELEFSVLLPDKKERWLSVTPMLIKQETGALLIAGFVVDNTALKENEANVQRFASKKNSLLEILSHDLSGPIINIQGLTSLLAKESKAYNNPKIDKMIEMIAATSERSVNMIREFVKQEFLETVNVELVRKRVNLIRVTKQIVEQYKAAENDIAKVFVFDAVEDEIFVEIDEYKFNQVLNNLISNAIKFTADGGTITIRIENSEDKTLLTVADDGIGIPAKYHVNLFEKFTKARRPGLKGEPSVGLGMSIIKTIVEWHGGKIWFESKENEGSTFYIEVPKKTSSSN
jgi:two-component system sensor histidine kinase VicK